MAINKVPLDGRCFWPSTFASIPANWSQDTSFGKAFMQSADAGEDPGATGGGSHLHSDTHSHNISTHTHTLSISGNSSGVVSITTAAKGTSVAPSSHPHLSKASASASMTMISASNNTTSTEAIPPHTIMVILKPDDDSQDLPQNCVAYSDQSTAPGEKWVIADGTGSIPDLREQFFWGADSGQDGGGTSGSSTHNHSYTHSHTLNSHSHSNSDFGNIIAFPQIGTSVRKGASAIKDNPHHQAQSISSTTQTIQSAAPSIGTANNDPSFIQLLGIYLDGVAETPSGVIIPYVGTIASVPNQDGWFYCDGTNGTNDLRTYQIKSVSSGVLTTGGSNTHTHSVASHSHTGNNHTHTYTFANTNTRILDGTGFTIFVASSGHTHSSNAMANTAVDTASNSSTTDSGDVRSDYRKVIFIKHTTVNQTVHIKGGDILGATIK